MAIPMGSADKVHQLQVVDPLPLDRRKGTFDIRLFVGQGFRRVHFREDG